MKKRFHLIIAVFLILSMVFGSGLVHKHAYAEDAQTAAPISNQEVQETQETPAAEEQAQVPTQKVENQTESSSNEKALLSQTIQATIYTSSTYREKLTGDKTSITLKGKLPENAVVKAYPVKLENDAFKQKNVLAAYDITIFDAQGNEFEPDSSHPIEVTIDSNSIKEKKDSSHLNIYHMDNAKAKPEAVNVKSVGTEKVIFEAKKFSIYVVADDATTAAEMGTSLQIDNYVALEPGGSATMKMKFTHNLRYIRNIRTEITNTDGITVTSNIEEGNGTITINAGEKTGNASFTVKVSYEYGQRGILGGVNWYSYTEQPKTVYVSILPKATVDSTHQGNITYSKTADKTGTRTDSGDPIYNLNLSFTGQKSNFVEKQRVNVVFIVDTSYSMSEESNGSEDRIQAAQDAIEEFEKVAGPKDENNPNGLNIDARYALVRFSGDKSGIAYDDATIRQGWKNSVDTTKLRAYGGTNYEAGLLAANNLLRNDHTDATKLVIFLTDGEPNLYYDDYGSTTGNGSGYDSRALNAAKTAISNLQLKPSDYFYAIGCGTAKEDILGKLSSAAKCKTGVIVKASAKELSDAFAKIAAGTTTVEIKNVTITDELSQYVELVDKDDKDKIKVQSQNADGTGDYEDDTKNWEITIDDDGKKVTAKRKSSSDTIDHNKKYILTIPVHASKIAKDNFVNTGIYPDKADPETGTYASKEGYYSNTKATVKYTDNNGNGDTLTYPQPVIRVYRMQIQKTFSGIDLSSKLKEKEGNMTFSITGPPGVPPITKDFTNFGGDNTLTFSVPDYGDYTVNETVNEKEIAGYHLVNDPGKPTVNVPATVNVPDSDNPTELATVTFYNNYQRRIKVIKEDNDTNDKLALDVTFAKKGDSSSKAVVTTSEKEDKYIDLDKGIYIVTESDLPKYENSIRKEYENSNDKGLTLTVKEDGTVSLPPNSKYAEFSNDTLTLKNKQLMKVIVKKTVDGNMGDTAKKFQFKYTIKRDENVVDTDTFDLKDGEQFTLGYDSDNHKYNGNLKYGDTVEIIENDGNNDGYKTSYVVGDSQEQEGATVTIDSLKSDGKVTFTNTRTAVAPTSMVTNSIPFIVAIAFGLLLAIKIKKNIKSKE
ncbi:vWA domain-containing protein [Sharpea azabuensis]|uniref:vWA domain-containing protein n=1 Tax=Sharpea azabuensis TaxID=322505 RepID=UPI0015681CCF|nr:VWA domain-containing protein [Sharpea azabuensis]